jgi:hypothetical protein
MEGMKRVISASRRTDVVAFFPEWMVSVFKKGEVKVLGPSGHTYRVDLHPSLVHTVVLWSKNFSNLIEERTGLREVLRKYDQVYCHFTITGLGDTYIERGVPAYRSTLAQLGDLVRYVGIPERITVRFDPILYWKEGEKTRTNLTIFEKIAPSIHRQGIKIVRISIAQWYKKAVRRAQNRDFHFLDPPIERKLEDARFLVQMARKWGLELFSCSQDFLSEIPEIRPSSCIDGQFFESLHPDREPVSTKKDRTQRVECRCTESIDIGSYTQFCPHSCIYCYANPKT